MNKKKTDLQWELDASVSDLLLDSNNEDFDLIKHEFMQRMKWFQEEFDEIFSLKAYAITEKESELACEILDELSETINEYRDEGMLQELVSTLNKIEKNHPELFE
jgi:hypothetical protein